MIFLFNQFCAKFTDCEKKGKIEIENRISTSFSRSSCRLDYDPTAECQTEIECW